MCLGTIAFQDKGAPWAALKPSGSRGAVTLGELTLPQGVPIWEEGLSHPSRSAAYRLVPARRESAVPHA